MKDTKILSVQSVADVITNSSSEVFVIEAPGYSKKEIQKLIEDLYQEMQDNGEEIHYSGMGSDREVYDASTISKYRDEDDEGPLYPFLPEGYFVIDMDSGLSESLGAKIRDRFKVVDNIEGKVVANYSTNEVVGLFEGNEKVPEKCFPVAGGLWTSERIVEYSDKVIEESEKKIEELAECITPKTIDFMRTIQKTMNELDDAKASKKSHLKHVETMKTITYENAKKSWINKKAK